MPNVFIGPPRPGCWPRYGACVNRGVPARFRLATSQGDLGLPLDPGCRGSWRRRPGGRRSCGRERELSCRTCKSVSCAACSSLLPFSIAQEGPCHSRHIAPGGCHVGDVDGDQSDGLRGSRGRAQAVGGAPRLEPLPFERRPMPLVSLTLFSLDPGRRPARLRFQGGWRR